MTISRRTLILGSAAAAVAAGGGGYLAGRSSVTATPAEPGTSAAPASAAAKYRSRPDLDALPHVTITTPASKARTVTFVAEHVHPERISAPTQGNFRELADGGSFVGWGQQPHFTEHDADGRVRLAGHLPGDNQSYRAYKARWVAAAQDQPALGLRVEGGNTIVSASWNGHTGVRRWRARAGGQPGKLAASAEAERAGFETSFPVAGIPEYVVAEALDEAGRVLGSSSAIPVRV